MFLLYINDLHTVCKHTLSILFADDTNLFKSGRDLNEMTDSINQELQHIAIWLKVNKLSLNIKKTQFMIFSRKLSKTDRPTISLKIDGQSISETDQAKFLGVIIDNNLSWKEHIRHICRKVSKGIAIIIKLRPLLSQDAIKSMYYSFVYPYFTYCNHIWGCSSKTSLNRLFILQKKAIRILCHAKNRAHTDPLFKHLDLLPLYDINTYLIGQFMFKVYQRKVPDQFQSMFSRSAEVHTYHSRQESLCQLPRVHSEYAKQSISYKGALLWNKILANNISPYVSIPIFKRTFKIAISEGKFEKIEIE